jgi:uncharacterized SAM-binding protein YcdF (DUF218 family)
MTFIASKLFWAVMAPGNLLVVLLLAGVLWLARSGRRRGLRLIGVVALLLLTIAVMPLGQWMAAPLEGRFPVPSLPERVDGVIVLGGGVDAWVSRAHGQTALNEAGDRVVEAAILARRHPEARLVLSGGEGTMVAYGEQEAEFERALLIELGVPAERIVMEDRSRNTYENAVFSREVAKPRPGEVWLLVTSATHMPRAVGCFRHAGWHVVPYPVDFRTGPSLRADFALTEHLGLIDFTAKEWIGLVAYRLLGRTDALFPGP